MLGLLIAVVLVVLAWNKGWKARALLPPVIGYAAGWMLAFYFRIGFIGIGGLFSLSLLTDLVVIIALIAMACTGPRPRSRFLRTSRAGMTRTKMYRYRR